MSNLALKYQMKKRSKKMAKDGDDDRKSHLIDKLKSKNQMLTKEESDELGPVSGRDLAPMSGDSFIDHMLSKKNAKKMAEGGESKKNPHDDVPEPKKEDAEAFEKGVNQSGYQPDKWVKNLKEGLGIATYAGGGEVEMDMIGHLMNKRAKMMSEGGKVANADEIEAGFMPNEFDDLHLRDDLESSYTGANSGDELGDAQEDHDRADIIAKIMASRRKKDRMPHPA